MEDALILPAAFLVCLAVVCCPDAAGLQGYLAPGADDFAVGARDLPLLDSFGDGWLYSVYWACCWTRLSGAQIYRQVCLPLLIRLRSLCLNSIFRIT